MFAIVGLLSAIISARSTGQTRVRNAAGTSSQGVGCKCIWDDATSREIRVVGPCSARAVILLAFRPLSSQSISSSMSAKMLCISTEVFSYTTIYLNPSSHCHDPGSWLMPDNLTHS
jgi:hypothetical protein